MTQLALGTLPLRVRPVVTVYLACTCGPREFLSRRPLPAPRHNVTPDVTPDVTAPVLLASHLVQLNEELGVLSIFKTRRWRHDFLFSKQYFIKLIWPEETYIRCPSTMILISAKGYYKN